MIEKEREKQERILIENESYPFTEEEKKARARLFLIKSRVAKDNFIRRMAIKGIYL